MGGGARFGRWQVVRALTYTRRSPAENKRRDRGLEYVLGIDESNHGQVPEILVATLSTDSADSSEGRYPKLHKGAPGIAMVCEAGFDYRFLLIPSPGVRSLYRDVRVRARMVADFVRAFGRPRSSSYGIYVDGIFPGLEAKVDEVFKEERLVLPVELVQKKDGDRTFRVVNAADTIARSLRTQYTKGGEPALVPYKEKRLEYHTPLT